MMLLQKHALDYTWELELQKRHMHMVWPFHCVIGDDKHVRDQGQWLDITKRDADFRETNATRGHEIVASLHSALEAWKQDWKTKRSVTKQVKTVDIGNTNC